jgi:hypothetical protein
LFLTFSANFGTIYGGECPKNKQLIHPCTCHSGLTFNCKKDQDYNLKRVFEYASRSVHWNERKYHKLHISNRELTELEECTFSDASFEEILISNAEKLTKINTNAFGLTRMNLKRLTINNANLLSNSPPNHNIFEALSSMNNIEKIAINGINLTEIPEYAFRPLLGSQWNLKEISIYGPLQKVGNYAFYDYPYSMKNITLGTQINFISAHAFDMRGQSFERLTIKLSDNLLTASSFESGVFMNSKRPLFIDLSRNRITFLDENIFKPFIDNDIMNQIDVEGNPLDCDCRMKWLVSDGHKIEKQILNAICNDGKPLWSHTIEEVGQCKVSDPIFVNA